MTVIGSGPLEPVLVRPPQNLPLLKENLNVVPFETAP
jgi:hypothetical protein